MFSKLKEMSKVLHIHFWRANLCSYCYLNLSIYHTKMISVGCWPSFGLRNILRSSRPVQMCKMYASRKRAWQRQTRRQCLYLHLFPNTEFTVAMLIFPISGDLYSRGAGKVDARVWHHDGCLVSLRLFSTVCKGVAEGRRVPGSPQTDVTSSTRLRPSRPPHGAASRTPSPTLATLTTSLPTPSLQKKLLTSDHQTSTTTWHSQIANITDQKVKRQVPIVLGARWGDTHVWKCSYLYRTLTFSCSEWNPEWENSYCPK